MSFAWWCRFAGTPPTITPFSANRHSGPQRPAFRGVLPSSRRRPPTYVAILLALCCLAYMLFRTPLGLAIRMTGENPHAAEAQGINPMVIRMVR